MLTKTGEGIILRQTIYGDADIIFEIFSAQAGKISILAKGVRKQKSKNRGVMQLFSYIEYEIFSFSPGDTFYRLKRSTPIIPFVSGKLEDQVVCALLSEISLAFLSEEKNTRISLLWKEFLDGKKYTKKIALAFLIRFFSCLGIFPEFSHASDCQTPFTGNEKIFWESEKGLFLSTENLLNYKPLPFALLKVFSFANKTPLLELEKVNFSVLQEREIWEIFWWFYSAHAKFLPRSKKMFDEML